MVAPPPMFVAIVSGLEVYLAPKVEHLFPESRPEVEALCHLRHVRLKRHLELRYQVSLGYAPRAVSVVSVLAHLARACVADDAYRLRLAPLLYARTSSNRSAPPSVSRARNPSSGVFAREKCFESCVSGNKAT